MAKKVTVQVDGKTLEIELPEGYVGPEEISANYVPKTYFEHEVNRKAKSAFKKQLAELKDNPDKQKEFLASLGIDVGSPEGKGGKLSQDQLKQAQAEWEKVNVAPLKEQLTKSQQRIAKLTGSKLERDIIAAAAEAGIRKEFLTPIAAGQPAPFVTMVRDMFGFSDEHDDHFVRGPGEGEYAYSSNPSEARVPFKTVGEYITKDFVKLPHAKMYIADERQRGAGLNNGGGGQGGSGNIRLSREEAKNVQRYRQATDEAAKRGVEVELID